MVFLDSPTSEKHLPTRISDRLLSSRLYHSTLRKYIRKIFLQALPGNRRVELVGQEIDSSSKFYKDARMHLIILSSRGLRSLMCSSITPWQDTEVTLFYGGKLYDTGTSYLPKFVWEVWGMAGTWNQASRGLSLFQRDSQGPCFP